MLLTDSPGQTSVSYFTSLSHIFHFSHLLFHLYLSCWCPSVNSSFVYFTSLSYNSFNFSLLYFFHFSLLYFFHFSLLYFFHFSLFASAFVPFGRLRRSFNAFTFVLCGRLRRSFNAFTFVLGGRLRRSFKAFTFVLRGRLRRSFDGSGCSGTEPVPSRLSRSAGYSFDTRVPCGTKSL